MRPSLLRALLSVALLPSPALADERAPGTVAVGDRVFLAPGAPDLQPTGVPPADVAEWMKIMIELTTLDWFRAVLDSDPLMGPLQVELDVMRMPDPPADFFSNAEILDRFGDRARVPDELRFEGYDVQTVLGQMPPREFVIRPASPMPDFMLRCHGRASLWSPDILSSCKLLADYPPDPSITLSAEMFNPLPLRELAPELPAIVARLRELALCLDVTDAPPADPEAALAALLAENPTLEGCEDRLSS